MGSWAAVRVALAYLVVFWLCWTVQQHPDLGRPRAWWMEWKFQPVFCLYCLRDWGHPGPSLQWKAPKSPLPPAGGKHLLGRDSCPGAKAAPGHQARFALRLFTVVAACQEGGDCQDADTMRLSCCRWVQISSGQAGERAFVSWGAEGPWHLAHSSGEYKQDAPPPWTGGER